MNLADTSGWIELLIGGMTAQPFLRARTIALHENSFGGMRGGLERGGEGHYLLLGLACPTKRRFP